jgi:monoterpene epsilon-lactone hydrolase
MASFKHEVLKGVLNMLSLPMYWKLPPVHHLRSMLETSTMAATLPWGVTFEEMEFELFDAEWLMPNVVHNERVLLYLHGGGYVIGSPHTHRALAGKIAKGIFSNCLLIDYRKAPEHPFPAALEDALEAYRYLLSEGYQPDNITIVGDSAGGGLAIALQFELKELSLPLPSCTVLLSPYLDLTGTGSSIEQNAKNDRFLDVFEMRKWAEMYANGHAMTDPKISPLFGDVSGLPPILIQASESEVLYDDSIRFVKKLEEASVEVTFQTWKGLIHWWHMFGGMPEAKEAIDMVIDFVNEHYGQQLPGTKTA